MGLFRPEALAARRERLHGDVVLTPSTLHTLLSLFLLAWLAAALLFLTQASYSRKETVRGWLEPAQGVVRVYPRGEGRLAELLVTQGESVSRGRPLAAIDGILVLADGEQLEQLLLREYQAQRDNLQRQLRREQARQLNRETQLRQRLATGRSELAELDRQLETVELRSGLDRARQQRHRQLAAAGHITRAEQDKLREATLLLEAELRQLSVERLRHQALLEEVAARLQQLPDEVANNIDRLQMELSHLNQEIAQLRGKKSYVLQAPVAGQVASVGVSPGQALHPGKPLLTLLPASSPLVARLLVPVRAAGFLRTGQQLAIRYDAFPYQKYGVFSGEVLAVATSTTLPGEHLELPIPIREPVFRVTAQTAGIPVDKHGQAVDLRAGMTLQAEVVLEHRTLLQWLLEPLYSIRGRLS